MSENEHLIKKPVSIIQEIENRLEDYLCRQREEIEKSLEERIQKERQLARQQLSEIEQAVKKQWQALEEYSNVWEQFDEKCQEILKQITDCQKRIASRQKELEELARATAEDIKTLNQWQERLEELRRESMERAVFIKQGLEEKFGLKPEMLQPAETERISLDLTPELEKLKIVKELLLLESGQSGRPTPPISPEEKAPGVQKEPEPILSVEPALEAETRVAKEMSVPEPDSSRAEPVENETQPLSLEDKLAKEIKKTITERLGQSKPEENQKTAGSSLENLGKVSRQELEEFYRQEKANGYSPIGFYQKGKKYILDAEELLTRMREAVEEAKKLNYKLAFVTATKEQFYLKQEIISLQEVLRQYLLRIILLMVKKNFRFPAFIQDLLNQQTLEELSDLLAVENWSSADDISQFEQRIINLTSAFETRTTPASIYYGALKKELEA